MRLDNNLDAGPAGTTISVTNSSNASNDAFDAVTLTGTGTAKYAAAVGRPTAEFVGEFDTTTSAGAAYCEWSTSMGAQTHFWVRQYLRLTTTPPTGYQSPYFTVGTGATTIFSFEASDVSPGNLQIRSLVGSLTVSVLSTYPITLGEWVRFEGELTVLDPGTIFEQVAFNAYLYGGDLVDSDTIIDSQAVGESSPAPFGSFGFARFGLPVSHSRYEPSQLSGLAISDAGLIGPAPRQHKAVPGIQPNFIAPHVDTW